MSVINKMLQDLDHRNAAAAGDGEPGAQAVKPVNATRRGHEWFWRVLAVLVLISVSWVAWVAYQLQPRSVVTPMTLRLADLQKAEQARALEQANAAVEPKPAPVVEPPKPEPVVETPKPAPVAETPKPAPVVEAPKPTPAETFKLARSIETPIPAPKAAKPAAPKPQAAKLEPLQTKVMVDKRSTSAKAPVNDRAEAHFRRAAQLLGQGRVSEAEAELGGALKADPAHVPARQAYVALLLEQQRVNHAMGLLREAVDANPAQPTFALALARVYAEQRDYPASLDVMDKAGAAGQGADFLALRGAVLQRLGRHAEAVGAYEKAVESAPHVGGSWTGLGISLEALKRDAEAAQAYKRALGSEPLAPELRDYAQARIKALR